MAAASPTPGVPSELVTKTRAIGIPTSFRLAMFRPRLDPGRRAVHI